VGMRANKHKNKQTHPQMFLKQKKTIKKFLVKYRPTYNLNMCNLVILIACIFFMF